MRLVKAAMAEASKQTTLPKRKQLRNVMTGQSLCAAAPLELPYATSSDGGQAVIGNVKRQDGRSSAAAA
jgi:hypothetical protein